MYSEELDWIYGLGPISLYVIDKDADADEIFQGESTE